MTTAWTKSGGTSSDGIAELQLEAWRYAGIPSLALLQYQNGKWEETFRIGLDWCVDGR